MIMRKLSKKEARVDLANELANLVEALNDPIIGDDILEELEEDGEVKLFAVLGKNKTIIVIKKWSDEEIEKLREKAKDEWQEYFYEN